MMPARVDPEAGRSCHFSDLNEAFSDTKVINLAAKR